MTDYDAIDAEWSQRYWADRAAASYAAEASEQKMYAMKGQQVVVTKGRKVPVGTTGEVFWVGESTFGYTTTWRVGFKTAEGETYWTAASNVEVASETVSA